VALAIGAGRTVVYQLFLGRDFGIVGFLQHVQHSFHVHLVEIGLAVDESLATGGKWE
jgi:hypothetical protein